ncbi:auxin-responsive protein SAUR21-like [Cucumis melo var. makuwa]|uniref:Auxin-responsive protein SAUR21-like n=1 Tax=Cucumis melo var. makuwa TaxID=1194695 RepID=A0A5A7TU59_CUCMM|nr:auxin-responsive protein SAUR21-like [Cucumis melo var. makuwa]TYJ99617.1 auxin-responsive protein SAUR21-like [Cucumis melo var. makuwa]
MGFRFTKIVNAVHNIGLSSLATSQEPSIVRKGYCAVYVGESQRKRFVIPISYLNQPFFKDLLCKAEEEFGYNHPMGGLTIPCSDDTFTCLISHLH